MLLLGAAWGDRSDIDRTKSYAMELCVPPKYSIDCYRVHIQIISWCRYKKEATGLFCSKGFFASLPAMPGSLDAIREMGALPGTICSSGMMCNSTCP